MSSTDDAGDVWGTVTLTTRIGDRVEDPTVVRVDEYETYLDLDQDLIG